jgi:nitric oxide reductase subunit C
MIKKSNRNWSQGLFYGGSVFFLTIFAAMAFDTVLSIERRGHIGISGLQPKLIQTIAKGKAVWEQNNCNGCHTLLGEGALFASELSPLYQRYDGNVEMIKAIIKNRPGNSMQGSRSMPQFNFTEQELDAVIEFLKYSAEITTAKWPPHQEG